MMVKTTLRDTIKGAMKGSLAHPIELSDRTLPENQKKEGHWGYHLMLELSDCNKAIDDEKAVEDFLEEIVTEIDMRPIGPPTVIRVDSQKEGRGVTGVQIIETSTITFHGDDDGYDAYIDVFSCKEFDPEIVIKKVNKDFQPKRIGSAFFYRDAGIYPKR